jgi:hypothetical protein
MLLALIVRAMLRNPAIADGATFEPPIPTSHLPNDGRDSDDGAYCKCEDPAHCQSSSIQQEVRVTLYHIQIGSVGIFDSG